MYAQYYFVYKQRTAYEMRSSDWSSDVCSSDLDGAAGTIAEAAPIDGGQAKRLLLVGIGEGGEQDLERGGAALTAKLQTSGVAEVHVDFASTGQSDPDDVLAFAMGARLRNWRLATYRTRLAAQAQPSLKTVPIASPHGHPSDRLPAQHTP